MDLTREEEKLLEKIHSHSKDLAAMDGSDPREMLREEGFPRAGLKAIERNTGFVVTPDLPEKLKKRGLIEEREKKLETVVDRDENGMKMTETVEKPHLFFSEEALELMDN
ncbi:MAG: hypothetical protein ABEK01_00015 [Candidatus Nanohaloarchaea archaeon]